MNSTRHTGVSREVPGGIHVGLLSVELVCGWMPPFAISRLRTRALRATGIQIGNASAFWGMPTLVGSGNIASRLSIGEHCGFNVGCYFELEDRVQIGDHVSVGHDVMFLTRGHEVGSGDQRAGALTRAPVIVEEGVWLGARCTILPGVRVGAGSVIGASVVVTQDVPPNTLLMGSQKISLAKWR